jgi:hypothetical protein
MAKTLAKRGDKEPNERQEGAGAMNQGIADGLVFFAASGSLAGKKISPAFKHFPDGQSKNPTRQN